MKVYGICGKKGSGKDTVADFLIEDIQESGFTVSRIAFADVLKKVCSEFSGIPLDFFYRQDLKEYPLTVCGVSVTPRQIMQKFGTDFIQGTLGWKDHWSGMVSREISLMHGVDPLPDFVFITDVRFEHEVEMIRYWDGDLIHVTKDYNYSFPKKGLDHLKKFWKELFEHKSEKCTAKYIDCFEGDYVITNDQSIERLAVKCDNVSFLILSEIANGKHN